MSIKKVKLAIAHPVILIAGLTVIITGCQMAPEASGRDITFDLSPDGTRIVFPGTGKGVRDLYLLDLKTNKVTRLTETDSWETEPKFSPDGRSVVYTAWTNPKETNHYWHLHLLDLETRQTKQLTHGQIADSNPQFTPDGKYLVFNRATRLRNYSMGGKVWDQGGVCAIEVKQKNPKVVELPIELLNADIRKDGKVLVHSSFVPGGNYSPMSYVLIDLLASLKSGKLKGVQMPPYTRETNNLNIKKELNAREHAWSLSGSAVAFIAYREETERDEIWLMQSGKRHAQVLTDLRSHVECPRFAPDNDTVYFLKLETDLFSMKNGIWKVNKNKTCVQIADYTLFDNPLRWKPKSKR